MQTQGSALAVLVLTATAAIAAPPVEFSQIEGAFDHPFRFTPAGGRLAFEASVNIGGLFAESVWITSGTTASTRRLLFPTTDAAVGQSLLGATATKIFVSATSPTGKPGLYAYDLPSGKTQLLRAGQVEVFSEQAKVAVSGKVFYTILSKDFGPTDLYRSDGTATGTRLLRRSASWLVPFEGGILYQSEAATPDGSAVFFYGPGGHRQVFDGVVHKPVVAGGHAYFNTALGGEQELWTTDGTRAGTMMLSSVLPGPPLGGGGDQGGTSCLGRLLFFADRGTTTELWTSDGTTSGTGVVTSLPGEPFPAFGADLGGSCLFYLPGLGSLWKTDLSPAGTMFAGNALTMFPEQKALAAVGWAFFLATDPAAGPELWASDGTPGGTALLADLEPGPDGSNPDQFTRVGRHIFFSKGSAFSSVPRSLWVADLRPLLAIDDASAWESTGRTVKATFVVRLSDPSTQTVTVDYATEGGTAQPGSDFTAAAGTLTFAPGEVIKRVSVLVAGDGEREGSETFQVRLTNATESEIEHGLATGTIHDPRTTRGPVTPTGAAIR